MAKVAVLIGQLAYVGGVGIAAVNEVRELRKLGVEAELVVLFRKEEFEWVKTFETADIPVIFLSDRLPRFLRINFKIPRFAFFSFFHISSIFWAPLVIGKYDVIVAHETYNCFSAIACAKYTKAKLISFIWDPISYIVPRVYGQKIPFWRLKLLIPFFILLDKMIVRNSELVLICSSLHKKFINSISRVPVINLFPGADVMKRIPQKKEKTIISLTKWDHGKNPEFLLKVAHKINGDFEMIIAGNWVDPVQREEFINKIKIWNLENKIKLVGKVMGKEKMQLFSKSRVLIHPIKEAFGMFALEAAACGCPVIIPKGSGVCELFKEGEQGFFPKEGDVNAFADKVNLLLNNDKIAFDMGRSAWLVAKENTWVKHGEKLYQLIKTLMNKKSSSQSRKEYDLLHQSLGFGEELELYDVLASLLKGKKSVDIGCGSGLIERLCPETVGVDFSVEALKIAKKNGARHLVKAEAENLPFSDSEFEISLSNGVLEHCFDQKKAISEMVRVSKIQIIIAHARLPYGLEYIRKPIVEGIFGLKDQPIEKPLSLRRIEKMLNQNGSRTLIRGIWNYIDPRWLWKKLPYGFLKWPSHYFVISVKTENLKRKYLGENQ